MDLPEAIRVKGGVLEFDLKSPTVAADCMTGCNNN
jgi:hypothetical protein